MIFLWTGIGLVVLVAGFFVYQNVILFDASSTTSGVKERISRLDIPKEFGDAVFSDPRLNEVTESMGASEGYAQQHPIVAGSSTALEVPAVVRAYDPGYGGKIFISWSIVEGDVTGYVVYRSSGSLSQFEEIGVIKGSALPSMIDANVQNDVSYLYQVKAVKFVEQGRKSNILPGNSSDDGSVVVEQKTGGGNVISWQTSDQIEAVQILRIENGKDTVLGTFKEDETLFVDQSGKPESTYTVVWYSTYRESQPSSIVQATPTDTTAPQAPQDIRIIGNDDGTKVALYWTNPLDPDFDHVRIYRSSVQGSLGQAIKQTRSGYYVQGEACKLITPDDEALLRKNYSSLGSSDPLPEQDCYIDEVGIEAGEEYWYTLVSYDLKGNHSIEKVITSYGRSDPFASIN